MENFEIYILLDNDLEAIMSRIVYVQRLFLSLWFDLCIYVCPRLKLTLFGCLYITQRGQTVLTKRHPACNFLMKGKTSVGQAQLNP